MPELLLSGPLGRFLRQVGLLLSRTPALVALLALHWLARRCYRAWARDRQKLEELMGQLPPDAWKVLLYHTPDLAGTAAGLGVDLHLAGHTHGGQIHLPWFGAVLTASRYWKR